MFMFLQIVLPTGTIVTMSLGAENSINVWITASATDRSVEQIFGSDHAVLGRFSQECTWVELKIHNKMFQCFISIFHS